MHRNHLTGSCFWFLASNFSFPKYVLFFDFNEPERWLLGQLYSSIPPSPFAKLLQGVQTSPKEASSQTLEAPPPEPQNLETPQPLNPNQTTESSHLMEIEESIPVVKKNTYRKLSRKPKTMSLDDICTLLSARNSILKHLFSHNDSTAQQLNASTPISELIERLQNSRNENFERIKTQIKEIESKRDSLFPEESFFAAPANIDPSKIVSSSDSFHQRPQIHLDALQYEMPLPHLQNLS